MTVEMEALGQAFSSLGLDNSASSEAWRQNFTRPIEAYRMCLVKHLSETLDLEEEVVQKCVSWPNNIDNGDLTVVLPKLRPGVKANETAVEVIQKVHIVTIGGSYTQNNFADGDSSPMIIPYFACPCWTEFNFESSQNPQI